MSKRPPVWLLPNLLSLDAPIVAVAWMWLLGRTLQVQYFESSSYWLLAGMVWCVYAFDRLKDVSSGKHSNDDVMPDRHRFHWKCRWLFRALILVVLASCGYYALFMMPSVLLTVGVVGAVLVALYLYVSRLDKADVAYFKNFVAGMTFAFGVAAPVVVVSESLHFVVFDVLEPFYVMSDGEWVEAILSACGTFTILVIATLRTVLLSMHVLLFGLLCVMNINAIDLWEHSRNSDDPEVKQESELALSMGLVLLVVGSVFAVAFVVEEYSAPFCYAVMVSAGLLHIINRKRARFSVSALRVLADLALVLPIPFVVWLM